MHDDTVTRKSRKQLPRYDFIVRVSECSRQLFSYLQTYLQTQVHTYDTKVTYPVIFLFTSSHFCNIFILFHFPQFKFPFFPFSSLLVCLFLSLSVSFCTLIVLQVLQRLYLTMRAESSLGNSIPVTTRHLESLIRLSQARARLDLRQVCLSLCPSVCLCVCVCVCMCV